MAAGSSKIRPPGWSSSESSDDEDSDVLPADMVESFFDNSFDESPPTVTTTSAPQVRAPPRFAKPRTEEEVQKARNDAVCEKTKQDTKWCVNIWEQWREQRSAATSEAIPSISGENVASLPRWLSRFILEARKKTGDPYPPETLYHIVCGIVRRLRADKPEVDFFHDKEFAETRTILDSEMKRLKRDGIRTRGRKADPITPEEEEVLWNKGILGDHNPEALLNAIFYLVGVSFALRSGSEHRALRHPNCQISVVEPTGKRPYLHYREDSSKNNPGGLKGRKIKPKEVVQYANVTNTARCPVRLFKLYNSLCPKDRREAFYLQPLKRPTKDRWYSINNLGHNPLNNMVKKMCAAAGLGGYRTNHSLRATAATRLFRAGIDEQLIMERTGHRSVDGVRNYKRTSEEQIQVLSDVLNLEKRPRVASSTLATESRQQAAYFDFSGCINCTINVQSGNN